MADTIIPKASRTIEQLHNELGAAETALSMFELENNCRHKPNLDVIFDHQLLLNQVTEAKSALRCALAAADGNYPNRYEWL